MEHNQFAKKSVIVPMGPTCVRMSSHAKVSDCALHLFNRHSTQSMCCLLDVSVYTIGVFNLTLQTPLDDSIKDAQGTRIVLQVGD